MTRKPTTIAQEIEDRMWYLADPAVRWVAGSPGRMRVAASCMIYDSVSGTYGAKRALSYEAGHWLDEFFSAVENDWAASWNDSHTREEVIERLQEAVDQARWEGV